jgi:hypothetical protein
LSELFNAFGNFTVKTPQIWEFHGKFVEICGNLMVNSGKFKENRGKTYPNGLLNSQDLIFIAVTPVTPVTV